MSSMAAQATSVAARCGAPMRGGRRCVLACDHAGGDHRGTPRTAQEKPAAATAGLPPPPRRGEALCGQVDPELFFPGSGWASQEAAQVAKRICARCGIRAECLDYALAHAERYGVWGGTTEPERRTMRRQAASLPAAPAGTWHQGLGGDR